MLLQSPEPNSIHCGDCLELMQRWSGESIDLIYLDPPFNSNANYSMPSSKQSPAFNDTWKWNSAATDRYNSYINAPDRLAQNAIIGLHTLLGKSGMLAYLIYMAERLEQMHRLLKPTGSIYLHCDPTANHYLKILMDMIFGAKNFRNEIAWCYGSPGSPKFHFPRKHDTILYFSKGHNPTFNPKSVLVPHKRIDKNLKKFGRAGEYAKTTPREELNKGKIPFDWWNDIAEAYKTHSEYTGYPTQKPLKLLQRIITASSKEGDVVLDPFCGCGTTLHAAEELNRKWIGTDISQLAIGLSKKRLLAT